MLSVLPPAVRAAAESLALFAPAEVADAATCERLLQLRGAIEALQVLDERFRDEPGRTLADLQRRYDDGA